MSEVHEGPAALVGSVFDRRFKIDTFIGEGHSGGFVYRAHDIATGTPMAVRCPGVPEDLIGDDYEQALEVFLEEADTLERASKSSSDVERLISYGLAEPEGVLKFPFTVFEWLEGKSLEQHIKDRAALPSVSEALAILEPAARGLGAVHAQGVAHLDVRPQNLWLAVTENRTRLKVTQFVLASRLVTPGTTPALRPVDPRYGAPEQFKRSYGALGPPTDVYNLTLCLVELLSGKQALEGKDAAELYIASSDLARRPTLRARGVHVSDAIEAVIARALAVDPRRRWQNARELWEALVAAVPELTPSAPLVRPQDDKQVSAPRPPTTNLSGRPPSERERANNTSLPPEDARLGDTTSVAPVRAARPSTSRATHTSHLAWIVVAVAALAATVIVASRIRGAAPKPPTPAPPPSRSVAPPPSTPSAPTPSVSVSATDAVKLKPFLTDMVKIPAGTFTMGTNTEGKGDGPMHAVSITKAFYIDRTPVTAEMYATCINEGACTPNTSVHVGDQAESPWGCNDPKELPKHPANCIDRGQAEKFCASVEKRLPTEAEWEYAARGTDARAYPWGNTAPTSCSMAVLAGLTGDCRDRKGTSEVGHTPDGMSPFGVLDMAGNVWEWVFDGFEPYPSTEATDPAVPPSPQGKGVLRGGSWDYAPTSAKTTYRLPLPVNLGNISTGFRCARDAHD